MPEAPHGRGLIDTSVVIDLPEIDPALLPEEIAISSLTLAELASGPHAAGDEQIRAQRQDRLQRIEAGIESLPFDSSCARAYGRVYAAILAAGRKARGAPRARTSKHRNLTPLRSEREAKQLSLVDLLIAATAIAHELPLYTRNPADLRGLDQLLEIRDLSD